MPIYVYEHPETKERYDDVRSFSEADDPYIADDGQECPRVLYPQSEVGSRHPPGLIDKKLEVWEKDRDHVRKMNPKYVRTRDGQRIQYNPSSMG